MLLYYKDSRFTAEQPCKSKIERAFIGHQDAGLLGVMLDAVRYAFSQSLQHVCTSSESEDKHTQSDKWNTSK